MTTCEACVQAKGRTYVDLCPRHAATNDLLLACERLIRAASPLGHIPDHMLDAVREAHRAIRKARGERRTS